MPKQRKRKNNKREGKKRAPPKAQPRNRRAGPPLMGMPKSSGRGSVDVGGALGQRIGNFVAPGIGGAIGRAAGRIAGSLYGHVSGRGDYKVTNSMVGASVPTFGASSTTETKREFLGYVTSSTEFNVSSYSINPGQSRTFPWLAGMAGLFEEWALHGLIFEFVSQSATAIGSTNTALGNVIMATEYDAAAAPFTSSRQMMATLYCNSGVPSQNLLHAVECAPRAGITANKFVRTGPPLPGTDIRLSDWGNFQIATEGMQAPSVIGALWVTFQITFYKPVLSIAGGLIPTQVFLLHGLSGGLFAIPVSLGPPEGFFPLDFFNGSSSNLLLPDAEAGQVYECSIALDTGVIVTGSILPTTINATLNYAYENGGGSGATVMVVVFTCGPIVVEGIPPGLLFTVSFTNGSSGKMVINRLNDYTFLDETPDTFLTIEDKKVPLPPKEPVHVLRTCRSARSEKSSVKVLDKLREHVRHSLAEAPVFVDPSAKVPSDRRR